MTFCTINRERVNFTALLYRTFRSNSKYNILCVPICFHVLLIYISEIQFNSENPIFTSKLHKKIWIEGFRHGSVKLNKTLVTNFFLLDLCNLLALLSVSFSYTLYFTCTQHNLKALYLVHLGIESKQGENFLSLQCKDKGEGGGLKILLVKIVIHNYISMPMPNKRHRNTCNSV